LFFVVMLLGQNVTVARGQFHLDERGNAFFSAAFWSSFGHITPFSFVLENGTATTFDACAAN
jgi:hypothetical protein